MSLRADLLLEIERFLSAMKMPATAFGQAAVNDGHLVHDLRIGREPSEAIADRVRAFILDEKARVAAFLSGEEAA